MTSNHKSPSEIIAGALQLFTSKGRRWNNSRLVGVRNIGTSNRIEETYCALGALSKVAVGEVCYPSNSKATPAYINAAALVAEAAGQGPNPGFIPDWNDNLPKRGGFAQVKKVFCKALKVALAHEQAAAQATPKKPRKRSVKRAT